MAGNEEEDSGSVLVFGTCSSTSTFRGPLLIPHLKKGLLFSSS